MSVEDVAAPGGGAVEEASGCTSEDASGVADAAGIDIEPCMIIIAQQFAGDLGDPV